MATAVPTQPRVSKPALRALVRAWERAQDERIVVYRLTPTTLGVATVKRGWSDKPYTITITGTGIKSVSCNCLAGLRGQVCKHAATAMFARKHGVYAVKPQPSADRFAGLIA